MGDRRSLASFTSGDYDFPPATNSGNDTPSAITSRLASLRRALEETREQARAGTDLAASERHARIRTLPRFPVDWSRRRRDRDFSLASLRDASMSPPLPDTRHSVPADTFPDSSDNRQRKRRKLHHSEPRPAFTYGHYGQVEPGRLKLVIESCDGDVHNERGGIDYGPENILKHDKSVYCTRSPRCNIILRHHDSSPFTLEKLHIIAPENGFTAPLRDGLVYIGMSRDDLLPHLRNTYPQDRRSVRLGSPPPNPAPESVHLSLLESLHDPEVSRALLDHHNRDWSPFDISAGQDANSLEQSDVNVETDSPQTADGESGIPSSTRRSEPRRIGVYRSGQALRDSDSIVCDDQSHDALEDEIEVVVLTDDEVTWPEDPSDTNVLQDRQRRDRSMGVVDDEDMFGSDARFRNNAHLARRRRQLLHLKPRPSPLVSPLPNQIRSDKVTWARFDIKHDKHSVAIKFDPPVSGTHILLKLQTPFTGKNIDIQTIIACGYAGPRFFPAVQFS